MEQRTSVRRKGKPVRILVFSGDPSETPLRAWVVNRSRGGVRIVSTKQFAAGAVLAIRTIDAPEDIPWVQVEVRNCRPKGPRWALGCKFLEQLPWSMLLLFG
jgi:hypothetical protein